MTQRGASPLVVHLPGLPPEGATYEGEVPATLLELEGDHFARAEGPIAYRLAARVVSGQLVVSGTARTEVSVLCSRCGGFFSTKLEVSSFLRAYETSQSGDEVDVAPGLREDILLELPSFPICPWAGKSGNCPYSGVSLDDLNLPAPPAGDARWDALDGLGRGEGAHGHDPGAPETTSG